MTTQLTPSAEHWIIKYVAAFLLVAFGILGASLISVVVGTAAPPAVTIYVQAPEAGQDAYTVTYDCEQHDDLALLLPDMLEAASGVLLDVGKNWSVFETKRGLCRQARLMGKEVTGRMDSKHLIGAAVDFICWDKNGKGSWDCEWEKLGTACRNHGLIWGGDFPKINDPGHCELPPLQPF